MPKKPDVFGTINPVYPKKAFVAFLFLAEEQEIVTIYPVPQIFTTLDEIIQCAEENLEELAEQPAFSLEDIIMLLPITYVEAYPLQKSFWESPSEHFDDMHRVKSFIQAVKAPELYQLLVTPSEYERKEKRWFFDAALPFLATSHKKLIEQFMFHSDYPVNMKAKNAALYQIGQPFRFNWKTKELSALFTLGEEQLQN